MGAYNSCTAYCDDKKRRTNKTENPYNYNCSKELPTKHQDLKNVTFNHCINMCKICGNPKECSFSANTTLKCDLKGLSRDTAFGLMIGLPLGVEMFLVLLLFIFFGIRRKRRVDSFDSTAETMNCQGRSSPERLTYLLQSKEIIDEELKSNRDRIESLEDGRTEVADEDLKSDRDQNESLEGVEEEGRTEGTAATQSEHPRTDPPGCIGRIQRRVDCKCLNIGAAITVGTMLVVFAIGYVSFAAVTKYADDPEVARKYVKSRGL